MLRQLTESIQILIGSIQQAKHLAPHTLVDKFAAGELVDAQSVALLHHLGYLVELMVFALGHFYAKLHIVVVLAEATYSLDVLRIVRVIVVDIHRRQFVETIHQHTLAVGIDEAQRPCHMGHTALTSPLLDCFEQCRRHLQVVDEVEPAEAHLMTVPALVGTVVDDGCHTSHHLTLAQG